MSLDARDLTSFRIAKWVKPADFAMRQDSPELDRAIAECDAKLALLAPA
ncbi:hypothetical protein [Stutzerimonas stutzeri]